MTVDMYDAVTASRIPSNAKMVAGYLNGRYRWSSADWARFSNTVKVGIVVHIPGIVPPNMGQVLDVEAGDATNARQVASDWVNKRRAAGIVPTLYTSKATYRYLAGLPCDYWLADYTGRRHILAGSIGTQWSSTAGFDLSTMVDGWPRTLAPNAPVYTPGVVSSKYVEDLNTMVHSQWFPFPEPPNPDGQGWTRQPINLETVMGIVVQGSNLISDKRAWPPMVVAANEDGDWTWFTCSLLRPNDPVHPAFKVTWHD